LVFSKIKFVTMLWFHCEYYSNFNTSTLSSFTKGFDFVNLSFLRRLLIRANSMFLTAFTAHTLFKTSCTEPVFSIDLPCTLKYALILLIFSAKKRGAFLMRHANDGRCCWLDVFLVFSPKKVFAVLHHFRMKWKDSFGRSDIKLAKITSSCGCVVVMLFRNSGSVCLQSWIKTAKNSEFLFVFKRYV
jgi:hypothetical protein